MAFYSYEAEDVNGRTGVVRYTVPDSVTVNSELDASIEAIDVMWTYPNGDIWHPGTGRSTPMDAGWTDSDARAAESEGWAIFDCAGSENGPWQIQAFDQPEDWSLAPRPYPFQDDTEVWDHIKTVKSGLHDHVINVIRLLNTQEYDAITAWIPRPVRP